MPIFHRIADLLMAAIAAVTGFLFTGQVPPRAVPVPETGPLTGYVNPFVGTGSFPWTSGMTNPAACAPFGAVRLGPDTCWPFGLNLTNVGTGGYWRGKSHIYGFSHTRISGAGAIDGGQWRVTPGLGNADPRKRLERPLLFAHAREAAVPGYYAVWLPEAACLAQLTATEHTGVHRYTFESAKDAHLFVDAGSLLKGEAGKASIKAVDEYTLEGSFDGRVFFYTRVDTPFEAAIDGWVADLNFGNRKSEPITMHVGMSYVSIAGAKANLLAESAGLDFDQVYQNTRGAWENRLASVNITAGSNETKKIFYTAMYHAMIHPTSITDVTGEYMGFSGKQGAAAGWTYRGDLSLWDTFRTTHPLYCLIAPDIQKDSAKSLLAMAKLHGGFPRWPRTTFEGG